MTTQTVPASRRRPSLLFRAAMGLQVAMVRGNFGPLAGFVMVITTTGRKTGKTYTNPIAYLEDGDTILGMTREPPSNWFKNALKGEVTLVIRGKTLRARAVEVIADAERQAVFQLYRQKRASNFQRLFNLSADAPEPELQTALASRRFIRFTILN